MAEDKLRSLLGVEARDGDGFVWELCLLDGADATVRAEVAALLAARVVAYSCPPHVVALWQPNRTGEPLSAEQREKLLLYLAPKLGEGGVPSRSPSNESPVAAGGEEYA